MDSGEYREYVNSLLSKGIVEVVFTKKDETIRRMICSTSVNVVPKTAFPDKDKVEAVQENRLYNVRTSFDNPVEKPKRKQNPDVCSVWDFEKDAWRSFKYDSIISIRMKDVP